VRSAVSTSSDIVRPWRAASRLSWAITVLSILRVVFICRYGKPYHSYGCMSASTSWVGGPEAPRARVIVVNTPPQNRLQRKGGNTFEPYFALAKSSSRRGPLR